MIMASRNIYTAYKAIDKTIELEYMYNSIDSAREQARELTETFGKDKCDIEIQKITYNEFGAILNEEKIN